MLVLCTFVKGLRHYNECLSYKPDIPRHEPVEILKTGWLERKVTGEDAYVGTARCLFLKPSSNVRAILALRLLA